VDVFTFGDHAAAATAYVLRRPARRGKQPPRQLANRVRRRRVARPGLIAAAVGTTASTHWATARTPELKQTLIKLSRNWLNLAVELERTPLLLKPK